MRSPKECCEPAMPELPEVETMRRGILAIMGRRITGLLQPKSRLQPITILPSVAVLRRRAVGRTIGAVERLGKRVVLVLDNQTRIVLEPRMTGRVLVTEPPNREHLRLVFELNGPVPRLMFWDVRGLGVVQWLSAERFGRELGPEKIGPDALLITPQELQERLGGSRRAIKVALLDQHAVAGIGNLYASEILHEAGIHPEWPCTALRPRHWQRLHTAIGRILREAIRCQGSTLSDGTYRTPGNQAGRYQKQHRVYQRAGQLCGRCHREAIVRLVQAQRSTFFCPGCQPR